MRIKRKELNGEARNLRACGKTVRVRERGGRVELEERIDGRWVKRDG